jgi:hypothetical protein
MSSARVGAMFDRQRCVEVVNTQREEGHKIGQADFVRPNKKMSQIVG